MSKNLWSQSLATSQFRAMELDEHLATCGHAGSRGVVIAVIVMVVLLRVGKGPTEAIVVLAGFAVYTTLLAFWGKRAKRNVEAFERARETWEMENFPEGEREEMVELYAAKGYSTEQAKEVVKILSCNKRAFVDVMMVEELHILPSPSSTSIVLHALITLVATAVIGAVPCLFQMLVQSERVVLAVGSVLLFACGMLLSRTTIS